jgi:hypothetical protein
MGSGQPIVINGMTRSSTFLSRTKANGQKQARTAAAAASAGQLSAQLHLCRHLLEQAPICESPIAGSVSVSAMNNGKFPAILKRIGIPIVAATWLLAVRLAWEQTVWSWENGPQMVGFSLIHSGVGVLLLLGVCVGLLWPVAVLLAAVVARSFGGRVVVAQLVAYALAWCVIAAPYGFWQRLFIWKFSPAQAANFLVIAAATGDLRTAEAFLDRKVNINAQSREGTALHGAVVEGNLQMIEYLIKQGADINAVNSYGDSPLGIAAEAKANRMKIQTILSSHGGIVIRGTAEERQRVIEEQVRRDSEKTDSRPR